MGKTRKGGFEVLFLARFLSLSRLLAFGILGIKIKYMWSFAYAGALSLEKSGFSGNNPPPIGKLHKTRVPSPAFFVHSYKSKKLSKIP